MTAVTQSDEDVATEVDEEPRRSGPTVPQALVLAFALAFLASVATAWWISRDPTPNAADVGFYDDMTTHHFQAIAMSYTYLQHGTDPVLVGTAKEIHFVQIGDIRQSCRIGTAKARPTWRWSGWACTYPKMRNRAWPPTNNSRPSPMRVVATSTTSIRA